MTTRQTLLDTCNEILAIPDEEFRLIIDDIEAQFPGTKERLRKKLRNALDAFQVDDVGDAEKAWRHRKKTRVEWPSEESEFKAGYSARDGEVADLARQKAYLDNQNESLRMIAKEFETEITALKGEVERIESDLSAEREKVRKLRDAVRDIFLEADIQDGIAFERLSSMASKTFTETQDGVTNG